jgi:hypothetical protein
VSGPLLGQPNTKSGFVEDFQRQICLQDIEDKCALGRCTYARRLAALPGSVQLVSSHCEGLVACVTCHVASESDETAAGRVRLRIRPGSLSGKCPCLGCSGSQVRDDQLGKHAAAALVVLSGDTGALLASSLPGREVRVVKTPSARRPDARSKRKVFERGETTRYTPPPAASEVELTLAEISEIVDPYAGTYAQCSKGEVPNKLREILGRDRRILGPSCAPTFRGKKYIWDGKSRRRGAFGWAWRIRGYCEAMDCRQNFDVGGHLLDDGETQTGV